MFVDACCRKDAIRLSVVPHISRDNHCPKALTIHLEARINERGKKTRDKVAGLETSDLPAT